jgi:DNA replication protein DnaC
VIEHHHKRVRFFSTVEFVNALDTRSFKASRERLLARSPIRNVVILDDLGYLPFIASGEALLFHLRNKLRGSASVFITANPSLGG